MKPQVPHKKTQWVSLVHLDENWELTPKESKTITETIYRDVTKNIKPVPKNVSPIAIVMMGAAGAGKSTVGLAFAKDLIVTNFVSLDADTVIRYHPRYTTLWDLRDPVTGKLSPLRSIEVHGIVARMMHNLMFDVRQKCIVNQYNLLINGHLNTESLTFLKYNKYTTVLIYVYTKLQIAKDRSWRRAAQTGQFFGHTRKVHEKTIVNYHEEYIHQVPMYSMLADILMIVDNTADHQDAKKRDKHVFEHTQAFEPHACVPDGHWYANVEKIQLAIQALEEKYEKK